MISLKKNKDFLLWLDGFFSLTEKLEIMDKEKVEKIIEKLNNVLNNEENQKEKDFEKIIWLNGFFELSKSVDSLSKTQLTIIKDFIFKEKKEIKMDNDFITDMDKLKIGSFEDASVEIVCQKKEINNNEKTLLENIVEFDKEFEFEEKEFDKEFEFEDKEFEFEDIKIEDSDEVNFEKDFELSDNLYKKEIEEKNEGNTISNIFEAFGNDDIELLDKALIEEFDTNTIDNSSLQKEDYEYIMQNV
jgi:hypothetical protein